LQAQACAGYSDNWREMREGTNTGNHY
jgi:hypothetical protein